jgi:type IV secretory pathway TraG/TraD family ATPase VirD4
MVGSLLVTKFQIDAMSRADIPAEQRRDFYLYIDEFQNFATESFATILSEARKYKLSLIVANQYIAQLLPEIKDAIFGNVGTTISFTL